ncbi:GNAT family N-acetyltransferase [Camelliibacillus cellulosilyticus]|uniref:GNAT family N-acetyltransferase n=1 Tax=Camelliibacillus cellulosilyticus TaxID=2174486 RepID=A0ABV9GGQ7_9BACL
MLVGKRVTLREIEKEDIPVLYELMHRQDGAIPEWKKWDAPYFPYKKPLYRAFRKQMLDDKDAGKRFVITTEHGIIGLVTFYWEHEASHWLEAGIVIFNPSFWNGGYGTEAMFLWIDHLFNSLSIVRCGFTTWSGNKGMMKIGEKLGMTLEARLRKCRRYNGVYYDSIRYGVLREEWMENRPSLEKYYKNN